MYELTLTRDAQGFYERADPPLVRRLHRCFEHLRRNPYEHSNIKRLRGPLAGCFRYRVGDWRVVYRVDEEKHVVAILLIAHRSEVYR
jgi:mRNA interferase RelE/StbE